MLATTAPSSKLREPSVTVGTGYLIEPKLDGIRCLVLYDGFTVRMFNRQLLEITHRFPEVAIRPAARNCILDGELICHGGKTRSDFQIMQRRANRELDVDAAAAEHPASYVAFDILNLNDYNLCKHSQILRRVSLKDTLPAHQVIDVIDPASLAKLQDGSVGEGVVLKHVAGEYKPGLRSSDWLKVKWEKTETFLVGGLTIGKGKRRDTFGALLVGRYDDTGDFVFMGEVGTGFNNDELINLHDWFFKRKSKANPFSTSMSGDSVVKFYVEPTYAIQVKFQEFTDAGKLRFPRYAPASISTS